MPADAASCSHAPYAPGAVISDSRPTAFTPAGYAFAIWGVIYIFAALFVIYQALPSKRAWIASVQGWLFTRESHRTIVMCKPLLSASLSQLLTFLLRSASWSTHSVRSELRC